METRTANIWLRDDGIIHIESTSTGGSISDVRENFAAVLKEANGEKRPLLIDLSKAKALSRDERKYYASDEAQKVLLAVALLIDSPLSRIMGNFFVGLNKPAYPLQLFTSKTKAVKWLKGFVK